jgi:transcriptional regulator GlxA family with amidase domain
MQMAGTRVIFLVLPHVHLLDLAGPDQVFHEAIDCGADITVEYCSVVSDPATSSRLRFGNLQSFEAVKVNAGDYLFVPGAEVDFLIGPSFPKFAALRKWMWHAYENGASICSVCTGAFLLARVGLLNGKPTTTHWKRTNQLKTLYPEIELIENQLFTESDQIFTSAGVTAGIDMALFILSKIRDDYFSFKVARELVVYMRRQGADVQQSVYLDFRNHIHSGIHLVQDYIQENIHKRNTLDRLASIANMSPRNITRVFKKETGITINDYVTLVRKERLLKLSANPDITRKQMAKMCGLESERQVIRLMQ